MAPYFVGVPVGHSPRRDIGSPIRDKAARYANRSARCELDYQVWSSCSKTCRLTLVLRAVATNAFMDACEIPISSNLRLEVLLHSSHLSRLQLRMDFYEQLALFLSSSPFVLSMAG
jgi:hypothetical protein